MTVDTTQIKQYIEMNLARIQGREDVAAAFDLPLDPLRKAFREAEGQALADFITEARMEAAKRLLRKTNLSSKEICYAVGLLGARGPTAVSGLSRRLRS